MRVTFLAAFSAICVLMLGCQKADEASPVASVQQHSGPVAAAGGSAITGAASSSDSAARAINRLEPPAQAVYQWLEAIRCGDDAKATAMLTAVARQKAMEQDRSVRPAASDTARFEIGAVEYIGEDGARVASRWTDLDENGQPQTDEALWVLRKEADGWRIAGVAATIFDGEPPLLLNFEDPEEMARKQQWAREEIQRRFEAQQQSQAAGMQPSEGTMMR